jgi:hypothetical protein
MYKIITDFNQMDLAKWSDFVRNHPRGNIFQTPEFFRFISRIPFYQPVVISALADDACICGILVGVIQKEKGRIKSLFSSRFIVWGGPLTPVADNGITDLLLNTLLKKIEKECIYIEFRNLFSLNDDKRYFEKHKFKYTEQLNFIVNTEDKEQTIKQISAGKKRQVRKSLASDARIITNVTLDQVRKFYTILEKTYRQKVGKPLPDWPFFEQFYHHPEIGFYMLVEYKGEIIGGIMCLVFGGRTIYEWYIAGEDGAYQGVYPSVLATWAPIDFAINNGLKQFDFLGAGKPGKDYGVREFKATFGGELVNYGRFTRINNRALYFIGKTGLKALKYIRA